jgi:hypothetical protein
LFSLYGTAKLAALRTLENLPGNYTLVSLRAGQIDQKFDTLGQRLLAIVPSRRQAVSAMHGEKLVIGSGQNGCKHATLRTL